MHGKSSSSGNVDRYAEVHFRIYGKLPAFTWKVVYTIPGLHATQSDSHCSCGLMTAEMIAFHAHTGRISTAKDFCQADVPSLRLSLVYQFCLVAASQRNRAVCVLPGSTGEIASSSSVIDLSVEPSESLNLTTEELAQMQLSAEDIKALTLAGQLMKQSNSKKIHIPIVIDDDSVV